MRQVPRHLPDDHDLLGVLLAEVGAVGADQAEEDRDDGGDAVEVARACRALERLGDGPDRHGRVEARRVDLLDRRREDDVDALGLADREVARLVARVARVVGRLVELARVDEDRHDRRGALVARASHQRAVTVVKPAHRRHEADRPWGVGERVAQLGPRAQRRASSGLTPAARRAEPAAASVRLRGRGRAGYPPSGASARRAVRGASAERLVEDRVVHPDRLGVARERAGRHVGRVRPCRLSDRLAQVRVRPGVARDEVAEAEQVGHDLDLAAAQRPGPDADRRDAQPLGDGAGQLRRHELEDDREGAGLLDRQRVGEEGAGLVAVLALDLDLAAQSVLSPAASSRCGP